MLPRKYWMVLFKEHNFHIARILAILLICFPVKCDNLSFNHPRVNIYLDNFLKMSSKTWNQLRFTLFCLVRIPLHKSHLFWKTFPTPTHSGQLVWTCLYWPLTFVSCWIRPAPRFECLKSINWNNQNLTFTSLASGFTATTASALALFTQFFPI